LFRIRPLLAWLFLATFGCELALVLVTRPEGVSHGAVFARYTIITIPVALLLSSIALAEATRWLAERIPKYRWTSFACVAGFLLALFLYGPLPQIYAIPNDFTNHSAFQSDYRGVDWSRSPMESVYPGFTITETQIPSFYRWLATQTRIGSIIEYPFDVCDFNNLYYYYQHFHRKRVLAGYCHNRPQSGYIINPKPGKDFAVGLLNADEILGFIADRAKVRFRNMVDIDDPAALSRTEAQVIVFHKYIRALKILPHERFGAVEARWHRVEDIAFEFRMRFGSPIYEDDQLVCFRLAETTAMPANK